MRLVLIGKLFDIFLFNSFVPDRYIRLCYGNMFLTDTVLFLDSLFCAGNFKAWRTLGGFGI